MSLTDMCFEGVLLSKVSQALEEASVYSVKVRRVSDQAEVKIINSKDEVHTILTITSETECCKVSQTAFVIHVCGNESVMLTFPSNNEMKRFRLQVDFKSKLQSVFDQRTANSSAVQYFQFYGYLSQQQNMMQDYVRTGTYQKAMVQNFADFRDKVVLDVGAGSGILSFFAMQAGARKVYAVEASTMAEHTKKLVSSSQYAGRIIVIPGKIEEISIPEQVDLIVSEPMGYMLFNERMLETYLHAKKFLRPNGQMFPTIGDLHVAPFSDELLYMEQFTKANFWYQQSFHGVDLSPLRDAAVEEYFKQPVVDTFDIRILMAKSVKYTVNFLTAAEEDLHRIEIPLHFTAHSSGTVHGFAFWFDIAFIGSMSTVWLSTAPTESLTHWYQVRCLFRSPLFIKSGEVMLGKVVLRSNKRQSYDVDIEAVVEATGSKAENSLDLKNPFFHYTGQPPQTPAGAHSTSPSEAHCSGVASDVYVTTTTAGGASSATHYQRQSNYDNQQQSYQYHSSQYQQQHTNGSGKEVVTGGVCNEGQQRSQQNGLPAYCNTVPLLSGGISYPGSLTSTKQSTGPQPSSGYNMSSGDPNQAGSRLHYFQ